MSTISLQMPNSLERAVKSCVQKDDTTMNQFVLSAVIEKISALQTQDYLEKRAERGSRDAFRAVLDKVPDVPAPDYDQ